MAKAAVKKKTNPMIWVGLAAVGVVAWVMTAPDNSASATSASPHSSHSATKKSPSLFTADDSIAHFPALNEPLKSAFRPLIAHRTGGTSFSPLSVGGFPSALGGPGWSYAGTVTINGSQSGIVENSDTGETVYLRKHDTWKGSTVMAVYPDHIVIQTPTGPVTEYAQSDDDKQPAKGPVTASLPEGADVLRGPIGDDNVETLPDISPVRNRRRRNAR